MVGPSNMTTHSSPCPPDQNHKPTEVNRRLAQFEPSVWGNRFINHVPDDEITHAYKQQQVEDLKGEVRREMKKAAAGKPSQQLNYINAVQQLGLAYLFEKEIEEALRHIYDSSLDYDDKCNDLHEIALRFRLLRQQGYNISCGTFNEFKDENGSFKESLIEDVEGMLGLYEATHLRVWGEDMLEEALAFTTTHLNSMAQHLEYPLAALVSHALYRPIRKGLERLEARFYISIYQEKASHSETLLKLAKLDFNLVQSLHKRELCNITRWWNDLDFSSKLPFFRDRVVETCFWMTATCFEPQYSYARRMQTKFIALVTVIDDIYDAYGTLEELQLFTEAIERSDSNSIDILPEYMKPCYQAVLDAYKEIEELENEGRPYCVNLAKEAMKIQVRAYFSEAKWLHGEYVPTIEEYMGVALPSSGVPMLTLICFVTMGKIATKEVFDWVLNDPKIVRAASTVIRLMDDMASHKFEQERGHIASSVECYMKQNGVSEQHAYGEFNKQLENAWKDINQAFLGPTAVPMPLLTRLLNFARSGDVVYGGREDAFTNVGEAMKANIASLFIDPVPM